MPKADSSETMLNDEMVMAPDCFLFSHETEGTLVIEIIDSGEGISKEGLERIFDPFVGA
jgi:signal transduction histidine kinase